MTKNKTLVFIIVVLLITNLAFMGFFIFKNKPETKKMRSHEQSGMYTSLKNEVGFSEDQLKHYQDLRTKQFQSLRPLFNGVRESKEEFYELLYAENPNDSLINAAADSIGNAQKLLDMQMFTYFKKIRSTCTPQQLPQFDSAIKKVVHRMISRKGKSRQEKKH